MSKWKEKRVTKLVNNLYKTDSWPKVSSIDIGLLVSLFRNNMPWFDIGCFFHVSTFLMNFRRVQQSQLFVVFKQAQLHASHLELHTLLVMLFFHRRSRRAVIKEKRCCNVSSTYCFTDLFCRGWCSCIRPQVALATG